MGLETSARAISSRRRSPPESDRRDRFPQALDVELIEQLVAAVVPRLAVHSQELHHAQEVLLHRELAEDARLLGQIAHAALAGAAIHGPARDVEIVEDDLALVGLDHAAGHAEAGGLAGAVGPQEAHDLALIDAEIDAVDDAPRPVVLHQSLDFKHKIAPSQVSRRTMVGLRLLRNLVPPYSLESLRRRFYLASWWACARYAIWSHPTLVEFYRTRRILSKLGTRLKYSGT